MREQQVVEMWTPAYITKLDNLDRLYVKRRVADFMSYAKKKRKIRPARIEAPKEFVPDISDKPTVAAIDGSVRCRQILELLLAERPLTVKEIAERLGMADRSVANKTIRKNAKYFVATGEQRNTRSVSVIWGLSEAGKMALSQVATQKPSKQNIYFAQRGKSPAAKKRDAEQQFLDWLTANQPATAGQISLGLRLSRRGVERRIGTLTASGVIRVAAKQRLGSSLKPTNFYEVVKGN